MRPIDWAEEIAKYCAQNGCSLRGLAAAVGVSVNYLSEVKNGKRPPSLALKIKIAERLGWSKRPDLLVDFLPCDAATAWKNWADGSGMSKDWKEVVASLCKRPGWSQKGVGEYLGVTQQTVGEWATGKRPVPALYKVRLAGMAGWDRTALALEDLLPADVVEAWVHWNNT